MNAVVFHEHGGPGKLQYQEMPMPTIGADEVLVRVKACALNHLDIWIRQGIRLSDAAPAYTRVGRGRDRAPDRSSRGGSRRRAACLSLARGQLLAMRTVSRRAGQLLPLLWHCSGR